MKCIMSEVYSEEEALKKAKEMVEYYLLDTWKPEWIIQWQSHVYQIRKDPVIFLTVIKTKIFSLELCRGNSHAIILRLELYKDLRKEFTS
jgi:hypothetical protein